MANCTRATKRRRSKARASEYRPIEAERTPFVTPRGARYVVLREVKTSDLYLSRGTDVWARELGDDVARELLAKGAIARRDVEPPIEPPKDAA